MDYVIIKGFKLYRYMQAPYEDHATFKWQEWYPANKKKKKKLMQAAAACIISIIITPTSPPVHWKCSNNFVLRVIFISLF